MLSESELSSDAKLLLFKWIDYRQYVERPSWDDFYMTEAFKVSQRSLDAQTQCGCVIVDNNYVPLSSGYNSFIRNIDDSILPNVRPEKYPWMIHSEHNALLNCARLGKSTLNATAYVTGKPCLNCYQFMYQAGIKKIIYAKINEAVMTSVDKEYEAKVEIFLYLTRQSLEVKSIDFDEEWLNKTYLKIKEQKSP